MPTTVQFRRGTTAQNDSFTGAAGEISVDTDLDTVRVHDGATAGGFQISTTVSQDNSTNTNFNLYYNSTTSGILRTALYDGGTLTFNPSTETLACTYFSGEATSALYADLAEKYLADQPYEPGTVVVFGGEKEVTQSSRSHDSAIAGVISTNPAYLMNNKLEGDYATDVALVGRVPCKVVGPVSKGTVLVTSEHAGVAMAIDNSKFVPGCIIGKAMQDHLEDGAIAIIEISVGRS